MNFTPLIRDDVFTFLSPLQPQEIEKLVVEKFPAYEENWVPGLSSILAPTPAYLARAGGDSFYIERQFRRREIIFRPNVEASLTWFDNKGTQVSALLVMPWQLRLKFIGFAVYFMIATVMQVARLINGEAGISGAFLGALVLFPIAFIVYIRFLGECRKLKETMTILFNGVPLKF